MSFANEQFMELFDKDLVTLPKDLPPWFIDQRRMMEEEEAEFRRLQESAEEEKDGGDSFPQPWGEPSVFRIVPSDGHAVNNEQMKDEETFDDLSKAMTKSRTTTTYRKLYYLRSSPLTTEDRSYKRKIIGKVE